MALLGTVPGTECPSSTCIPKLSAWQLQVVIGDIAQPNAASVALHERLGFEKVAMFKRVGRKI